MIKEIRAATDLAIRNQRASIKTLEIQIEQMSKVLQERGFGSLPSSTETTPRDHVKSISTAVETDTTLIRLGELAHIKLTVELADRTVKHPKEIAENIMFVYRHTKIDVFKRKITLRVGEEKIVFKSVKSDSSLIKKVYMLELKKKDDTYDHDPCNYNPHEEWKL
ncbi:hypothetical protein Tco_0214647 [Tanacetum coccineum]